MFVHRLRSWQRLKIGLSGKRKSRLSPLLLFVSFIANSFTTLQTARLHSVATRAAFETLYARMIFAPVLLIPKSGQDAEFIVAKHASKVGITRVLLQEDSNGNLRPCTYWARKLKDAQTRYSAYDREALAMVEAISRVWRMYLLDSKCFSVVIDHATLVHLLKQSSDNLTDRQTNWVEKLMPYANIMRILYMKGILNEADCSR